MLRAQLKTNKPVNSKYEIPEEPKSKDKAIRKYW